MLNIQMKVNYKTNCITIVTSSLWEPHQVLTSQVTTHCVWVEVTTPAVDFICWTSKVRPSSLVVNAMRTEEGSFWFL